MPIFCDAHALMLACVRKNDLEECAASRDSGLAPGWSWYLCLMVVTCNSFCQTEGASPQLVCSHQVPKYLYSLEMKQCNNDDEKLLHYKIQNNFTPSSRN